MNCKFCRAALLGLLAVALGSGLASRTAADEPAEAFLKALRDNGYYDVALDYLQKMSTSPLVSTAFKQRVKFEMAAIYLDQLESLRDLQQIEKSIERADTLLQEFAQTQPPADLLAESELIRATALFARGKVAWERGKNERATAAEKQAAGDAARQFFDQALAVFQSSLDTQKGVIKTYRVDPADSGSREKLERLQAEYVKTRFMSPTIKEQIADTLPENDPERKNLLEEAAGEYQALYEKYARYRQGSYSRFTAARCQQKLGNRKEALTLLIDLLASEIPRALKLESALLALDCWEAERPFPAQEVAGRIGPILESASARELRDPRMNRLQVGYAKACFAYAEQLDVGSSRGELSDDIRRLRTSATKFATSMARQPGPEGEAARKLLTQYRVTPPQATPAAETAAPTSFADARDQVLTQLETAAELQRALTAFAASGTAVEDPQVTEARANLDAATAAGLRLIDVARAAAGAETSREDLNSLILRECQLRLLRNEWLEVGVLGEFLVARYPKVAGSREAALLALRAYSQVLAKAANDELRKLAEVRLQALSQKIVHLWPGEAGSEDAANVLATLAIQSGDVPRALQLLDTIPPGSPTRGKLEVVLGRLLWIDYLKRANAEGAEVTIASDPGASQAASLLERGLQGFTAATATRDTLWGALNLAQLYLERGDVERAITQLETAPLAPLDLIKQQVEAAADPNFVNDAYRTALRAYIAGMKGGAQSTALIDKAQNVVAALRQSLGGEGAAPEQLVKIYYQLARELLGQLERLQTADEKNSFSQSLATFMRSIQENSRDGKTLLWVGSTLNSIADSLQAEGLKENAQVFRGQALTALESAEKVGLSGDPQAEALGLELQRQKAIGLRGQGRYDAALAAFAALLQKKPNLLNVQLDAADTLQLQAEQDQSAARFAAAMGGVADQGIWGWRRLALATRGKPELAEAQHRALYHVATCQFRYGQLSQREDARQAALRTLSDHFRQYPQLDGPQRVAAYQALAREIQTSLGQAAVGLK